MDKLLIEGGLPLKGEVRISGAKNATLPILAATLLAPGEHRITNVPELVDVSFMLSLLGRIGCPSLVGPTLRLDTTRVVFHEAPYDVVRRMRASVLVLGPLLARCGKATVSLPGGCAIGVRPIDQHLKGLEALGCTFELTGGYIHGSVEKLTGADITLDFPTVTGTENILMAAVLAEGETVLRNAAREPEVVDLVRFLRSLGARIHGEGTHTVVINGVQALSPAVEPYDIVPDRIETGTYLVASAITGGDVTCLGTRPDEMENVLEVLRQAGCEITVDGDTIRCERRGELQALDIQTAPHPGFPTDMQAQLMALMSLATGTSTIVENIFENRFMHVPELTRLGANILIDGNTAVVTGTESLRAATVMATDLRASASLVLAGLAAEGVSEVLRIYHLDRGYARLTEKLQRLGARVRRASGDERGTPVSMQTMASGFPKRSSNAS